jgi:hypothetical protein
LYLTLRFPLLLSQLPTEFEALSVAAKGALLDICEASAGAALSALAVTTPLISADLGGGKSYSPGSYNWSAAMTLTGTVKLIVPDDDLTTPFTSKWVFYMGAAFATAAGSNIVFEKSDGTVLANANYADGVYWKVSAAASLGANSNMVGNLEAAGAIAVGADATCDDLKAGGAIDLGAGAVCRDLVAGGALTLGANARGTGNTIITAGAFTVGAGATPATQTAAPTPLTDLEIVTRLNACNTNLSTARTALEKVLVQK